MLSKLKSEIKRKYDKILDEKMLIPELYDKLMVMSLADIYFECSVYIMDNHLFGTYKKEVYTYKKVLITRDIDPQEILAAGRKDMELRSKK